MPARKEADMNGTMSCSPPILVPIPPPPSNFISCSRILWLPAGKHRGRLVVQKDGCIRLQLTWDDPLGGSGHEVFRLASPTELHAHSHLSVNGRIVKYVTVYRKK